MDHRITADALFKMVQIRRTNEGRMEMSHGGVDPVGKFPVCSPGAAPPGWVHHRGDSHPGGAAPGLHTGKNRPGTPRKATCDLHPNHCAYSPEIAAQFQRPRCS